MPFTEIILSNQQLQLLSQSSSLLTQIINSLQPLQYGAAGGDLGGSYPNPTVNKIEGTPLSSLSSATNGQALIWNGASWSPGNVSGGVSILEYGGDPTGATDNHAAFVAAFAALSNVGTIQIPVGTYKINTNTTVPFGIVLVFTPGAVLYITTGHQFLINGGISAEDQANVFTYEDPTFATIPVLFASNAPQKYVSVYWFGATGNGTSDEQNALQATFNAFSQQVYFPPGSFQIRSKHVPIPTATSVHLFGAGYESKILSNQDTNPDWPANGGPDAVSDYGLLVFEGASVSPAVANNIEIDHLCFIGNTIAQNNTPTNDSTCSPNILMFVNYNSKINIHDNYFEDGQNQYVWQAGKGGGTQPPSLINGDVMQDVIFANNHVTNWGWNAQQCNQTTVASGSNGVNVNTFAGSGILHVAATAGFASTGTLLVTTGSGIVVITYTGTSGGNEFTGCTTLYGGAGVLSTSANVIGGNAALYGYTLGATGLQLSGRDITVIGNTFEKVANGMECSGRKITITGNTIREWLNQGIGIGDQWDVDTVTITGNIFETVLHNSAAEVLGSVLGQQSVIKTTDTLSGPMVDGVCIIGNTIRIETNAQAPWTNGVTYSFNYEPVFVSQGGNVYKLYSAGTATAAPSGTSTVTPTGMGATWLYVEPLVTNAEPLALALVDSNATVVGNSISFLCGASQTADMIGIQCSAYSYSSTYLLSSNIIRFLGPAASFAECIGVYSSGNGDGFLNAIECRGNVVTGLGANPPNASGTTQSVGIAFAFLPPAPPDTLLVHMNGDMSDGGHILLGEASSGAINVPILASVDTRPVAWVEGTVYIAGPNTLVTNNGLVYLCTVSGTANNAGGPIGYGQNVPEPGGGSPPSWSYVGAAPAADYAAPLNASTLPQSANGDGLDQAIIVDGRGQMLKGQIVGHRKASILSSGTTGRISDPSVIQFTSVTAAHAGGPATTGLSNIGALYPVNVASLWTPATNYIAGGGPGVNDVVTNGGKLYQCVVSGTSNNDGGPVGTGSNVPEPGGGSPPNWSYIQADSLGTGHPGYEIRSSNSSDGDAIIINVVPGEGLI
jgi:hypothetical protein